MAHPPGRGSSARHPKGSTRAPAAGGSSPPRKSGSQPLQKLSPFAVTTTTRTSWSTSMASQAPASSASMAPSMAFCVFGRVRARKATPAPGRGPVWGRAEGPDLALDDLRVIDLSQGIAGPYCAKMLADCGAEVIKVEPPQGDFARALGPFPDDVPHHDKGGLFVHLNGNKKSVTLDVETESGRSVRGNLLARASVLVENYAPSLLASLGLGYDDLKGELPELVYCSVTPFGQTGPYSGFQGNSLTCMALSGLMYGTGDPDKEPLSTGGGPGPELAGRPARG